MRRRAARMILTAVAVVALIFGIHCGGVFFDRLEFANDVAGRPRADGSNQS